MKARRPSASRTDIKNRRRAISRGSPGSVPRHYLYDYHRPVTPFHRYMSVPNASIRAFQFVQIYLLVLGISVLVVGRERILPRITSIEATSDDDLHEEAPEMIG